MAEACDKTYIYTHFWGIPIYLWLGNVAGKQTLNQFSKSHQLPLTIQPIPAELQQQNQIPIHKGNIHKTILPKFSLSNLLSPSFPEKNESNFSFNNFRSDTLAASV